MHELVEEEAAKKAGVQLIKRFTGGGTVIVDRNTIFNGLILNAEDLPGIECYPRPLMEWTAKLYAGVFGKYGAFSLQDQGKFLNDRAELRNCIPLGEIIWQSLVWTRSQCSVCAKL